MQALKLCALALALSAAAAQAADAAKAPKPSLSDVIKASKADEWRPLDPHNTLYMELPGGRVVIELAPTYAPRHVENIKIMAREKFYDGFSINRSQDNFVVQWGNPDETRARPLGSAKEKLKGEFSIPLKNDKQFVPMPDKDGYAPQVGHSNGFPAGRDPKSGEAWLAHCYGMVGVGRDNSPDSANGAELYVVTGQSPRQLDRNITVVGRVVHGMALLSTVARGPAPMGFFDKPEMRVPIKSVRVAADVPEAERTRLEVMKSESKSFAAAIEAMRNRAGPFYVRPAGHIDLCNAPIPVREAK